MSELSDTINRKFVDSIEIDDWQIENEDGWTDITHLNKTIPYELFILTTTNCKLECADNHIVFDESKNQIFVKDLIPGQKIIGEFGFEEVLKVERSNVFQNMYDLSVDGSHTYYAEGLLHHNTQVTAAFLLWYVLFNNDKTVAILANKAAIARETLQRLQLMFEELPKWLQQGARSWNKGSIHLENNSRVLCAATSSSGLRGYSLSCIYLDEFSIIPNNIADDFLASMFPTISSGKETKIIISSTPLGYNHFHKIWAEAEKSQKGEKGGNGFVPIKVHWYENPTRDEKWMRDQLESLGELKFNQEILCEFLGSGKTLISGATLAKLSFDTPIKEFSSGNERGLKIYSYPEQDHKYTMSVDVSRGRHLDYSAFTVFDISAYPHKIAATYRNNEIAPLLYTSIVHKIARNYNEAYTLIEINDVGAQVADVMWNDLEYESMFWTKSGDMLGKTGADPYPGVRTTKKTKRIGCANLKDMIDNNQLIINDYQMIQELSTFIQKDNASYEADDGFHDDTVATLWLHAWMSSQPWFSDLTDQNIRLRLHEENIRLMEEDLCMPVIVNGVEEYMNVDDQGTHHVPYIN